MTTIGRPPHLTEYIHPEAPLDWGVGRKCEYCQAKVNRYRRRMGSETKGPQGPLLCSLCARDWLDKDLQKAIAREKKKTERIQTLELPNLRAARKKAEFTQRQLGRRAGLTDSYISEIETGKMGAGYAAAHNMARSLGVTVDHLRGKE